MVSSLRLHRSLCRWSPPPPPPSIPPFPPLADSAGKKKWKRGDGGKGWVRVSSVGDECELKVACCSPCWVHWVIGDAHKVVGAASPRSISALSTVDVHHPASYFTADTRPCLQLPPAGPANIATAVTTSTTPASPPLWDMTWQQPPAPHSIRSCRPGVRSCFDGLR